MKRIAAILLLLTTVNSCVSQQKKSDLVKVLEKNIDYIEFSKLSFFPKELIQLAADSSFQSSFKKKLRQHDNVKRKTVGDQKEYVLTLHLLYKALAAEDVLQEYESGRKFLLALLIERSEINFQVDEALVMQQIDVTKRSLINGYDEGTIEESLFIFFL